MVETNNMSPASTVFIARHGERIDHVDLEWSLTAKNPYDPFLTEKGTRQAQALGNYLKDKNLAYIFASPFYRTVQTANEVAVQTGLPICIEPGLGEYLNTDWFNHPPQLKTVGELKKEFDLVNTSYVPKLFARYPESRDDAIVRSGCAARLLAARYSGNILLVAHGMTCEFMARGLTNAPLRPYIAYCALQTCTMEDKDEFLYSIDDKVLIDFMDESIRPVVKDYSQQGK